MPSYADGFSDEELVRYQSRVLLAYKDAIGDSAINNEQDPMTQPVFNRKKLFQGFGIGRQLMIYVIIFSGFVTLITTAVHFYIDYQSELQLLDRRFAQIEDSYADSIEGALWRLDDEQVSSLVKGVLRLRDIVHIDIIKDETILLELGAPVSGSVINRNFELTFDQNGNTEDLGTLRVTASLDGVYKRLLARIGAILINNAVIVFSVAIFIFFFVQKSISKHLTRISEYAKKINQAFIQSPLILPGRKFSNDHQDELDEVVASINEMRQNLHTGYLALMTSENRLKDFAEAASDWFWEMDAQLNYSNVSDRFFEISDYAPADVIGHPQDILYEGPAESLDWQQYMSDLEARKPFRDVTLGLSRKNGEINWLRISGQPVFDQSQNFQGYRGTGTDITNEVRAREEAVETTLRFLDAIENVSDGIAFWDSHDRFVLCNRIFRTQAGDAANRLVRGTSFEDYMKALLKSGAINKTPEESHRWLEQRIKERQIQTQPIEVYRDGKWLLIRDGRSADGSTVSVVTDITEVKRREQQLQLVTDAVPILLAYVDEELRYQLINKEYEDWFNVSRLDVQGSKMEASLTSKSFEEMRPHIDAAMSGQFTRFQICLPFERKEADAKSDERHVEISFTPNFDRRTRVAGFFVAAIDVTERIEAEDDARKGEQALSEQTQILRASFDAMAQGISIWDEQKNLTIWNQTFEHFMRLPEGFLKRGIPLYQVVLEATSLNQFKPGSAENLGREWLSDQKSGSILDTANIEYSDGQLLVNQRHGTPDGGFISMLTDITEQTRAQEQLQHTQKIDAIGQLTGGIAHDFNNLLAIIIGSLNLLDDQVSDERPKKLVGAALRASRRGAELTQRLLAFGRRQALMTELSNANELVEGMFELLTRTLGVEIEIKSKLGNDLWPMDVDRGQLENALLNLAINARDAMPDGGSITIETVNVLLGTDYANQHPDVEPGAYVMIAVSDTGTGMSQDIVDRAIDPFFTTKKAGAGSGLGLSMIYGFANQSGGHLNIYSEPDHGTVVRVYLPAKEGMVVRSEAPAEQLEYKSRGEHILVIEDDEDVRMTTLNILLDLGYSVTEAANDTEAFAAVDGDNQFDLIFSDVFLQGSKNGPEIAQEIRALNPNMKILFTSGYTADQFENYDAHETGMEFIPKPFEALALSKKLREILNDQTLADV